MSKADAALGITSVPDGVIIDVRVVPRAGRSGVAGLRAGALLVRLTAPPVDGAANAELVDVIAAAAGVPRKAVSLVSGDRSRLKRVQLLGITRETAIARLMS